MAKLVELGLKHREIAEYLTANGESSTREGISAGIRLAEAVLGVGKGYNINNILTTPQGQQNKPKIDEIQADKPPVEPIPTPIDPIPA